MDDYISGWQDWTQAFEDWHDVTISELHGLISGVLSVCDAPTEQEWQLLLTELSFTELEPKATSLNITDIKIDNATLKGRSCVTAFSFEINNNITVQQCLFSGLYGGKVEEMMADMNGAFTLAYNRVAQEVLDKQLTGATVAIEALITLVDGSTYLLKIPKAQISGDLPAGGSDRLNASLTYTVVSDGTVLSLPTLVRTVI